MKTILIVEDFLPVQQFLRETLESQGFNTIGAPDGNRAFEILANRSQTVHLVISDYHMPNGSGYELIRRVKENPDLAKIPFIFLTSESDPEIIKNIERMGCTGWVKKPYRVDVLTKEVEIALACNNSSQTHMFDLLLI